jgi:heme-degrading monooxygenase HmoA
MLVVANRVNVAPGWEQQFEERFRRRAGRIESQPGFVGMQVLRPQTAEMPYVVLTTWHDRAAFEQWVGSEDFKAAHRDALPAEAFSSGGGLEIHEVIIAAAASS